MKFPSLLISAALVFAACVASAAPPVKILYFTKSSNFEHSVVKRNGGRSSFSEKILAEQAAARGVEFTFSKDGSLFSPEYLERFDAFMFYTSGDLSSPGKDGNPPVSAEGKAALLDAVRRGRGFIAVHAGCDTYHTGETVDTDTNRARTWRYKNFGAQADPYTRMVGAGFIIHDIQQRAGAAVVDPKFPGFGKLGPGIEWLEEWYSLNDFSDDLHVLLALDTKGMVGPPYERPPFPVAWARAEGRGRVFTTALGHREDVWTNADFLDMLFGGIDWTTRRVDADITPNMAQVTPGHATLPPVSAPVSGRPKRPRITGLAHAAFYVSDLDAALKFYKDFLGYDEAFRLPRKKNGVEGELVWIKINDRQTIELFPGAEVAPDADRLYHIAIEVDDADAMLRYLASRGVKTPAKTPVGKIGNKNFFINDPDGNIVEIVEYTPQSWTAREFGKHMPATRVFTRMSHAGIAVGHLDETLKFYTEILGCAEVWRGSSDGKTLSWVHVKFPESDDTIELMLHAKTPSREKLLSMHHVCLEVENVEAAGRVLDARKDTLPVGIKAPTPLKTGINGKRQINYFDPDGTRVELMERDTVDGQPRPSSKASPPLPLTRPGPAAK